jgi:hypothetical protein
VVALHVVPIIKSPRISSHSQGFIYFLPETSGSPVYNGGYILKQYHICVQYKSKSSSSESHNESQTTPYLFRVNRYKNPCQLYRRYVQRNDRHVKSVRDVGRLHVRSCSLKRGFTKCKIYPKCRFICNNKEHTNYSLLQCSSTKQSVSTRLLKKCFKDQLEELKTYSAFSDPSYSKDFRQVYKRWMSKKVF